MRKSTVFFIIIVVLFAACAAAAVHAAAITHSLAAEKQRCRDLAAALGLSDLALFNEARYTRNLSEADLHSAFQEHPLSLEHFPSGSFAFPPDAVRR